MGLSIYYKGNIKNYQLINALTEEVKDICGSLQWSYHIFEQSAATIVENDIDHTPEHLKGIMFSPAECEPVSLTFLPNGKLSSLMNLMAKDMYDEPEWIYHVATKTQYAGPDVHIAVIKLLKYLQPKYFEVFELTDEGEYWETMNEKILLAQFKKYNFLVNSFADALSGLPAMPGETAESLADRIEKLFRDKFGEGK